MIVNQCSEGWEIVSHYTHGLLAGKFAMHLRDTLKTKHWADVLTAIIEHDDHILNFKEKNYLTKAGAPLDFTLDTNTKDDALEHAKRLYATAGEKSQLIALLIGRHLEFLFDQNTKEHTEFRKFFTSLKKERNDQLKTYDWSKSDLETAYTIVQFCDRCSLIICQRKTPTLERKIEINKTIDNKTYYLWQSADNIHITPWPFQESAFTIFYESKVITQLAFESNKALEQALENVKPQLLKVSFKKSKS